MTQRFARLCSTLALSAVGVSLWAQAPAPAPAPAAATAPASTAAAAAARPYSVLAMNIPNPDEPVTLKLPDGDVDSVLATLEQWTGHIILHPTQLPPGNYSIKFPKAIPKVEAIRYLETLLGLNGIGVIPMDDNAYKVVALTMAPREAPIVLTGSTLNEPPSGQVATKLFQLDFLRVTEFVPMIQGGVLNPNYGTPVQFTSANAVLVTDSISNLQRVELLLKQVDRPIASGMRTKFYPLSNAKAQDVVGKIRNVLQAPALASQVGQATSYSADDRTNQVILVADERLYPFFDELVAKLDTKSNPNTRNEVIPLKHADATKVATLITNLITGQTNNAQKASAGSLRPGTVNLPGQPTGPAGVQPQPVVLPNGASADSLLGGGSNEFSALATVFPDDRGNSLVVSGTVDDIRLIKELVEKIDTILAQVRIDVVIAEVTLDDDASSGISSLGLTVEGDKVTGFSGTMSGFATTNGTITRPGGSTPVSGPWDLAATLALTTTPRKTNTVILSTPSITTSHAKEATFISSEQRPLVTGTQSAVTGTGTTPVTSSTVSYTDIGITLTVTPLIGNDGSVYLSITQDVKDVIGDQTIDGNDQPIISHRSTKSWVTAKSGDILVLGGMQRKKTGKTTSRLGPIPIIGDLLGSRTRTNERTELVFFLRPVVLTNDSDADNASTFKRIDALPQKDEIRQQIDPNYVPPKKPLLQRIFPH